MSDSIEDRFKRDFNAVALSIPQVDRGSGDPRNILGLVIYHDLDTDLYRIAIKAGVVRESYSRNQFDCCPERLLTEDDVSQDKSVSLRKAVNQQSVCQEQGFKMYSCASMKYTSNKAKVLCNTRCHGSLKFKK